MSVFTKDEACRLAALTFRAGDAGRPLVGKEDELLASLRKGERRFYDWNRHLESAKALGSWKEEFPSRCAIIASLLHKTKRGLNDLDKVSRDELDSIARTIGSSWSEMQTRIDELLHWLRQGIGNPSFGRKKSGSLKGTSKKGVVRSPFEEFAKELRIFLISNRVKVRFSYNDIIRHDLKGKPTEATSAAARLLYEAAKVLDRRIKLADIEAVMAEIRRNPEFRVPLRRNNSRLP
jgi:hypothetical protein